ncbi:hypothetical protein D3C86_2127990 [compost metagenome]
MHGSSYGRHAVSINMEGGFVTLVMKLTIKILHPVVEGIIDHFYQLCVGRNRHGL